MKKRHLFNPSQVAASFGKAAQHYDKYAYFQREVVKRLFQRLELIRLEPNTVLDVGAGTGNAQQQLTERFPQANIVSVDISYPMLATIQARQAHSDGLICADAHTIPIADNAVDMIFSSLMLQWCNHLDVIFAEFQRVLKPGGLAVFSTLGPDTMQELRHAWARVDNDKHVHDYIDMHDVGDLMLQARLHDPVIDMEKLTVEYPDVLTIMRDIKQIGAHNMHAGRRKTLTGKSKLKQLMSEYETFKHPNGQYPLTYEVIYGHAWGTENVSSQPVDGEVSIPLSVLRNKK